MILFYIDVPNSEYVGKKFNKLTILAECINKNNTKYRKFRCKCDCGTIRILDKRSVIIGTTKSCGCLHKQLAKEVNTKHGDSKTRLYKIWLHMKSRCYNTSDAKYKNYGERGIIICQEWNDFIKFKEWAKNNGYKDDLTIERIDVNGNYEPSNCIWVDLSNQTINKTTSHYFKYRDKVYFLKDLVNIFNKSYKSLYKELVINKNLDKYGLEISNYIDYINQ